NAIRDEVKGRASFHREGFSRMVREYENFRVIGRVVPPPSFPVLVRPRPANGPEHVPAEDPRADVVNAAHGKVVVYAGFSTVSAEHLLERPRSENPCVQRRTADAQWVLQALLRSGAIAVDGNGEAMHTKLLHRVSR